MSESNLDEILYVPVLFEVKRKNFDDFLEAVSDIKYIHETSVARLGDKNKATISKSPEVITRHRNQIMAKIQEKLLSRSHNTEISSGALYRLIKASYFRYHAFQRVITIMALNGILTTRKICGGAKGSTTMIKLRIAEEVKI